MTFFFSHTLLTHILLLSGDVTATIVVGWGIIWESPSQPQSRHRIAMWLVIGGVAAETLCSISLFAFDESISRAQQEKIISLESSLAGRSLTKSQYNAIQTLRGKIPAVLLLVEPHCPDCLNFASQMGVAFSDAGIKVFGKFPESMEGGGGGCVYKSPFSDLVYDALKRGGFEFHMCGTDALKLWGVNPPIPVIGVGEGHSFPHPVKPYLGPYR